MYLSLCLRCRLMPTLVAVSWIAVSVWWASGCLSLKGGHGTFNVCNNLSVCCAHESKAGTDKSAHMLTRKNFKIPHPGDKRESEKAEEGVAFQIQMVDGKECWKVSVSVCGTSAFLMAWSWDHEYLVLLLGLDSILSSNIISNYQFRCSEYWSQYQFWIQRIQLKHEMSPC